MTAGVDYNDVHLPQGDFVTRLLTLQADLAFNIRWSWENFVQYDNVSDTIGVNSILRWIPQAGRETVLVINSQLEDFGETRPFSLAVVGSDDEAELHLPVLTVSGRG